jgi:hypothetical protein
MTAAGGCLVNPALPLILFLRFSALACDCHSRNFAERDAANLGTDPSVPRRRFCAAWTPGSVPGFAHGARTVPGFVHGEIAAARSHSLFNPAPPEAVLISALSASLR